MGNWTPVYSSEQREAIEKHALARKLSVAEIHRRCINGRLEPELAPFTIPYSSVAYIAKQARRRREGKTPSAAAQLPPEAFNDHIRQRFAAIVDNETARYEKAKHKDPDLARRLARLAREVAAMPGPGQRRLPIAPTVNKPESNNSDLARAILDADKRDTANV